MTSYFNPSSEINQATSGGSIFSPTANAPQLGYGPSTAYYGSTQPDNQPQQQQNSLNQYIPSNFTGSFKPSLVANINKFGESLGFGSGNVSYGAQFGPGIAPNTIGSVGGESLTAAPVEGSLGTSATLSQVLGGAAFGAGVGSLLNKGNPVAGMIGGGLGGILGAASGITSGISMGAALGSIVPGLGTVIGAVVGGLGSRLFGKKKPATNADFFFSSLDQYGKTSNGIYTSKNAGPVAGFAKSVEGQFSSLAQAASKDLGIDFSGLGVGGGISTRHPGAGGPAIIYVNQKDGNGVFRRLTGKYYQPDNPESVNGAMLNALKTAAQAKGYTDMSTLDTWFQNQMNLKSVGLKGTPQIPTAQAQGPSQFEQFLAQYKANQNANAVPT